MRSRALCLVLGGVVGACGRVGDDQQSPVDGGSEVVDGFADGTSLPDTSDAEAPPPDALPDIVDPKPGEACVRVTALPAPDVTVLGVITTPILSRGGKLHVFGRPREVATWSLADGWRYEPVLADATCGAEVVATMGGIFGMGTLRSFNAANGFCETPCRVAVLKDAAGKWAVYGAPGNCSPRDTWSGNARAIPMLAYDDGKLRTAVADADSVKVVDMIPGGSADGLPRAKIEGWLSQGSALFARYTAVGKYHLRTGEGLAPAVLDLDGLKMQPVAGAATIAGYGAVAVEEDAAHAWVYARSTVDGFPRLQRVDVPRAEVTSFDPSGLVGPGTAGVSQDLLVADGPRVWKMRFESGAAAVSILDTTSSKALVYKLVGDTAAAASLFLPTKTWKDELGNVQAAAGFFPPESLAAVRLSDDDIVVVRRSGGFAAVRLTSKCP